MRQLSFQQLYLALCVVVFSSYYLSVSASVCRLEISIFTKILSCEDLRKTHHDLNDMSRDELREHLYKQFRTKARTAEAYALAKYYGCRFPDEHDRFATYLKGWVKRYEEAILKEAEKRRQEKPN